MIAGDGLCDERAVRVLCEEGPRYTRELIEWGARFDRDADGEPALASEGAHSVRRVLHAADATGREIGRVLWERVSAVARIRVLTNTLAVSAIIEDGRCLGVRFIDARGEPGRAFGARDAARDRRRRAGLRGNDESGSGDRRWRRAGVPRRRAHRRHGVRPVPPDRARRRARAEISAVGGASRRGRAARRMRGGEPFMLRYHPAGDLAPRDVVSRSIVARVPAERRPDFSQPAPSRC